MISNPSNCCGIKTDACSNPIPDVLHATLENDCAALTSPIAFSADDSSSSALIWKGQAKFQCRRLPPFPPDCIDCTVEVQVTYAIPFNTWHIGLAGGGPPTGVTCEPFVLGPSGPISPVACNGCVTGLIVTITE